MKTIRLEELMLKKSSSLNPQKFPDQTFELWSIPSYDKGKPELLCGNQIGSAKKNLQPNDVLLSRIVPHIRRVWIVKSNAQNFLQIGSSEWIIFRNNHIFPGYLRHYLLSDDFHSVFLTSVAGVGGSLLRARPEGIKNLEIPLPPLDEQKRIAAILDQADEIRRKRQHAINRLNQLSQAIFYDMFGDPVTNPKDFKRISLSEIIKVYSGDGLTAANLKNGNIPVYGGNGITGWHNKSNVTAKTLIIGRVGVYCGVVHITESNAWVTDNALIVEKLQSINTTFLFHALSIANLNQYAGRSAQPLVSGQRIYPVKILLPDLKNQEEFANKILRIMTNRLYYQTSLKKLDNLFASLQHKAFRGEL